MSAMAIPATPPTERPRSMDFRTARRTRRFILEVPRDEDDSVKASVGLAVSSVAGRRTCVDRRALDADVSASEPSAEEVLSRRAQVAALRAQGMTIAAIAAKLRCDPKVVRRALRTSADSRTPPGAHGEWVAGLPYRAASILMREGYSDVDQVRHAINAGLLGPEVTHGLGEGTWKAICDWLGIDPTERTGSPAAKSEAENLERARQMLERAGYRVIPPKDRLTR